MRTVLIMAGIFGAIVLVIAAIHLAVQLFFWISGGELWGPGLLMTLVFLPFIYGIAREIEKCL